MATKTKPKAKEHATAHKVDVSKLYNQSLKALDLDSQDFRATLLRPDATNASVDGMVTSITWRYEVGDPVLQGEVSFQRPDDVPKFVVHDGHELLLEVNWFGSWREVWRMRLFDGKETLTGTYDFSLADDGILLQESTDNWHFGKSKKKGHPNGWKGHDIVKAVARRYRIPLGKIAECKHWITGLNMDDATPMQVIQRVYAIERRATGRRFVIRWQGGKLNILPMRRNDLLYVFSKQIQDATIGHTERDEKFATAVTVRASVKKKGSKKRTTIVTVVTDEVGIKQSGFIHKTIGGDQVKSTADAKARGRRYLNTHARRKRTISGMQHRGIAFIRRGDAMRVSLPQYGFHGEQGICYCAAGTWTLSGGSFDMSLDFGFDDPMAPAKQVRKTKDKTTRATKRSKRR